MMTFLRPWKKKSMTLTKTPKDQSGPKPTLPNQKGMKRKGLGRRLRPSVIMGLLAAAVGSTSAKGADVTPELAAVLSETIPAHEALVARTGALSQTIDAMCSEGKGATEAEITAAREALGNTLAAWARLQPYTFGPVEDQNHRARFEFWPDKSNATGRQMEGLLRQRNEALLTEAVFPTTSVSVQGLPALTVLLYPRDGAKPETARTDERGAYACKLAQAIDTNLTTMSKDMLDAWTKPDKGWRDRLAATAEGQGPMGDVAALESLFLATVDQGLALVKDLKLERPLGDSFKKARPTLAESPETGQSLRMAEETLKASSALYKLALGPKVAKVDAALDAKVQADMADIEDRLGAIDPPLSAVVGDLSRRFRVEDVTGRLDSLRARLALKVAPSLNIVMGFNSLDGD